MNEYTKLRLALEDLWKAIVSFNYEIAVFGSADICFESCDKSEDILLKIKQLKVQILLLEVQSQCES